MLDITISKKLAHQFAYECFDEIIQAVKATNEISCEKQADTTFSEESKKTKEVI